MEAIIVSIFTGIIVFFITWPLNNWMTKRSSKKEYYENIRKANNECLEVLREYILTFNLFDLKIVQAIIYGQSLKFKVEKKDMYNIKQIKALLVNEFISMRFIQDNKRNDILQLLNSDETEEENEVKDEVIVKESINTDVMRILTLTMTIVVAMVSMFTMFITIGGIDENFKIQERDLIMVMTLLITTVEILFTFMLRFKREKSKKRQKSEKQKQNYLESIKEVEIENKV